MGPQLFFTAGIDGYVHGLFGTFTPAAAQLNAEDHDRSRQIRVKNCPGLSEVSKAGSTTCRPSENSEREFGINHAPLKSLLKVVGDALARRPRQIR
jgi:hypothetical protein